MSPRLTTTIQAIFFCYFMNLIFLRMASYEDTDISQHKNLHLVTLDKNTAAIISFKPLCIPCDKMSQ